MRLLEILLKFVGKLDVCLCNFRRNEFKDICVYCIHICLIQMNGVWHISNQMACLFSETSFSCTGLLPCATMNLVRLVLNSFVAPFIKVMDHVLTW